MASDVKWQGRFPKDFEGFPCHVRLCTAHVCLQIDSRVGEMCGLIEQLAVGAAQANYATQLAVIFLCGK